MVQKIESINIDQESILRSRSRTTERERFVSDLLDDNSFSMCSGCAGPFHLDIKISHNKFIISIRNNNDFVDEVHFSLTSLRNIIKDYNIICESYFEAVRNSDPRKIEAIDMGRRGVHDEGAQIVLDLLDDKINMDFETGRKLFSLIYILQVK